MSVQATAWAWSVQGLPTHLRLTLLAIADACNAEGFGYPGQARLASMLDCSERQVRRNIKELAERDLMEIMVRPGRGTGRFSNAYQLALSATEQTVTDHPGNRTSSVGQLAEKGQASGHPLPVGQPDIQGRATGHSASGKRTSRARQPDTALSAEPLDEPLEEPSEETGTRSGAIPGNRPGKRKDSKPWKPPDWINPAAWEEFEQHRREIGKPLTTLARIKAANLLRDLSFAQQQQCIDQSIQARWAGLFPDKVKPHDKPQGPYADRQERRRQVADALISRARRHFEPMD